MSVTRHQKPVVPPVYLVCMPLDIKYHTRGGESHRYQEACSAVSVRREPLYMLYWGTNLRPQFPVVHECDISSKGRLHSAIFADYVVRQYDALMYAFTRATCLDINTKLSWHPHINKVQNKARKTLGLIKRTLHAAPP